MGKTYQTKLICTRCNKVFIVEIKEGEPLNIDDYRLCEDCRDIKAQRPGPSEIK